MKKRLHPLSLAIFLFLTAISTAKAKEWDPVLLQSSQLGYAGKVQEAEAKIDGYIQAHPEDPNGLMVKGIVLDWKATLTGQDPERSQQALLELYKTANLMAFYRWKDDPKNVDRLIDLGNSYLFLARKYSDRGDWLKAVLTAKKCQKHLELALELDPSRVDGLLALGGFHYLADSTPPGAAVFKKLLGIRGTKAQGLAELQKSFTQKHPYYYDGRYAMMFLYKDHEKNFPEALRILAELQNEFPENPELVFRRGMILEAQDKTLAIPAYLNLVEWCRAPGHACHGNYPFLGYYRAGQIAAELGKNTEAREYLGLAQKIDPGTDSEASARTWLYLAQVDLAEKNPAAALDKLQEGKTQKIPKDLKKEFEKTIEQICAAEKISGKC